jgi:hypothetical protein
MASCSEVVDFESTGVGHLADGELLAASEQQHDLLTSLAGECPEELAGGPSIDTRR